MATYKRQDGPGWLVDLVINDKRHRKTLKSMRAAKAYEQELIHQAKMGTYLADGMKVQLCELSDDFVAKTWKRHKDNKRMGFEQAKSREAHVRNYIKGGHAFRPGPGRAPIIFVSEIGHKKVAQLNEDMVETFLDSAARSAPSKSHQRALRQTLIGILDLGVTRKLLTRNVARNVSVYEARDTASRAKIVPPPVSLIQQMLKISGDSHLKLHFAIATGLRAGEQWAMRWHHIDFSRSRAKVRTAVSQRGVESTEGPKTEAGSRDIPLSATLIAELSAWRDASPFPGDDDLVFPSAKGGFLCHVNFVKRRFRPLVATALAGLDDRVEVQRQLRWHDLRHFAISQWIAARFPPKAIQTWAGHYSIAFTMDRYGHLFPDASHAEGMDAISALLHRADH